MDKVRLRHPRIDEGARVIEVPESAVQEHVRSGWERVKDDPPPQDEKQTEAPAETGASSLEDTEQSPRRRRANRGDE